MLCSLRRDKPHFAKGLKVNRLERWETEQGVPSNVWGWGILDLGKAMFGPGQFLGNVKIKPQSK